MESSKKVSTVVKSARPAKVKLSLYQQGNAVITEERQPVSLLIGKQLLEFDGMPTTYQQGSLVVLGRTGVGEVKLGPINYRKPNLNNENVLRRSAAEGKAITVVDGDGRRITGAVLLVSGQQFYLSESSGAVHILPTSSRIECPNGLPDGLSASASLCLEPNAKSDATFGLKVLYDASGIQWSNTRYFAVYNAKAKRFKSLACLVELTNNAGVDFYNAVLKLLSGTNRGRQQHGNARGIAPQMASLAMAKGGNLESAQADFEEAESGKVGEHDYYTLPGDDNTLLNGDVKEFYLVNREDVPVEQELYLPATGFYSDVSKKDAPKQGLVVKLRVVNDEASHLGKPLPPSAQFEILQADESGDEQKTDWASIGSVAVGEEFSFDLNNRSQDVKASKILTHEQEDKPEPEAEEEVAETAGRGRNKKKKEKKPRYRTETRETTVYNFKKDEAVPVLVYDYLHTDAEVTEESHKFADRKNGSALFRVTVPASGQVTIRYTAKWRVE